MVCAIGSRVVDLQLELAVIELSRQVVVDDLPTGGPRGTELTDRALRHGFQEETGALLACYYAALSSLAELEQAA